MDRSHSGLRCRTVRHLYTVKGALPRKSEGTIRYEIENLGRKLIFVDWDNGMSVPAFSDEIEVIVPEEERAHE